MLSRAAIRTNAVFVARRGFQTTRTQRAGGHGHGELTGSGASPYHYPEGPRSNLPFDPLKRGFAIKFWAYCATGFGLPFGIAVWQTKKNQ
ncbi:hypothetical protein BDV95DRAFT_569598 [Massariosphaeria phaeospora]|uniref:Cytochrome c oxidase subunit 8, mitochondrial n=1 Tax=Massariosphaeria phaeospora TaxID=100035 RepID=A0A7C8IEU1_9PLEO|nr:hypothetical protein BDV95DRAFT_569598 [Massariosphaeria phaeospora]